MPDLSLIHVPQTPAEWLLVLLAINAFTVLLFWLDKRRARNNDWRIPEAVLLGASFFGGSPAAFFAMRKFRHKTKKTSFRVRYWLVVIAQIGLVVYYLTSPDAALLQQVSSSVSSTTI